ncbi:hypothetical protein PSTT_16112 [Puccinia striiformis]|uniref:Uncharacterized protein n=1 Tax=Puccinia striiformis TaxID=27350 RepID=A0A2S4UEH2_9BASI|nr:hypothetical protein PSTT_16112 [Puccinia striiformis]
MEDSQGGAVQFRTLAGELPTGTFSKFQSEILKKGRPSQAKPKSIIMAEQFIRINPLISYNPGEATDLTKLYPAPNLQIINSSSNKRSKPEENSPPNNKLIKSKKLKPEQQTQRKRAASEPTQILHQPRLALQRRLSHQNLLNHGHHLPKPITRNNSLPSVKSPSKLTAILTPATSSHPVTILDEPLLISTVNQANESQPNNPARKPSPWSRRVQALKASSALMNSCLSSTTSTKNELSHKESSQAISLPPTRPRARRASRPPEDPTPPQIARKTIPRVETEQVKLAKLTKLQTNLNKKRFAVIKVEVVHLNHPRPPSPEGQFRKGSSTSKKKKHHQSDSSSQQNGGIHDDDHEQIKQPINNCHKKRVLWNHSNLVVDLEELYLKSKTSTIETIDNKQQTPDEKEEAEAEEEDSRSQASSSSLSSLSSIPSLSSPSKSVQTPLPTDTNSRLIKPILKLNFCTVSQDTPTDQSTVDQKMEDQCKDGTLEEKEEDRETTDQTQEESQMNQNQDSGSSTIINQDTSRIVYRLDKNGNIVLIPSHSPSKQEVDPLALLEPPFVKVSRRIWLNH